MQKCVEKMPDASARTPVLCEPAQSKCTWTCHKSLFPRIFVWGSCFCLCTPACFRLLPSPPPHHSLLTHTQLVHTQLAHTQLAHTHNLLSQLDHIQLTHTHTHNLLTHSLLTHTTYINLLTHTQLAHTQTHTQLPHTQLAHTQLTHTT